MATRLTALLIDSDTTSLHVGGAYSFIDPANNAVRYRSQPEFFIAETGGAAFVSAGVLTSVPPFVDTGVLPTQNTNLFAGELAFNSGRFYGQPEAIYAVVDRSSGAAVGFSGVSAQVAWILTGEHRPFHHNAGVLGRVLPACDFGDSGVGAWEVAARYSYLDLNDADVRGGRLNDWTLGLNWYVNPLHQIPTQLHSRVVG